MTNTPRTRRAAAARFIAAAATGIIAVAGLASPATAAPLSAAPVQATEASSCTVTNATLHWGVKERLRSYVSGSIANGDWTVSDDMKYETPEFIWSKVAGGVDSGLTSGDLNFTGSVQFTGHGGAMELNISDPAIEFAGDDVAYLSLTVGSTDTANAGGAAKDEAIRVAKINLEGAVSTSGSEIEIAGAVPLLTSEGADALNGGYGNYYAGMDMDPVTLEATFSGCEFGEHEGTGAIVPEVADDAGSDGTMPLEPEGSNIPWLPIGLGAAALLIIGITGGMLLGGRGKKKQNEAALEAPETPAK